MWLIKLQRQVTEQDFNTFLALVVLSLLLCSKRSHSPSGRVTSLTTMGGCSSTLHEFLPGKMAAEEDEIDLNLIELPAGRCGKPEK